MHFNKTNIPRLAIRYNCRAYRDNLKHKQIPGENARAVFSRRKQNAVVKTRARALNYVRDCKIQAHTHTQI